MAINVRWADQEQSILLFEFVGDWTWEEFDQATTAGANLAGENFIDTPTIGDLTQSRTIPKEAIFRGQRIAATTKETTLMVVVGASSFARALMDLLSRISRGFDFRSAASVDEAIALIKNERQT